MQKFAFSSLHWSSIASCRRLDELANIGVSSRLLLRLLLEALDFLFASKLVLDGLCALLFGKHSGLLLLLELELHLAHLLGLSLHLHRFFIHVLVDELGVESGLDFRFFLHTSDAECVFLVLAQVDSDAGLGASDVIGRDVLPMDRGRPRVVIALILRLLALKLVLRLRL